MADRRIQPRNPDPPPRSADRMAQVNRKKASTFSLMGRLAAHPNRVCISRHLTAFRFRATCALWFCNLSGWSDTILFRLEDAQDTRTFLDLPVFCHSSTALNRGRPNR